MKTITKCLVDEVGNKSSHKIYFNEIKKKRRKRNTLVARLKNIKAVEILQTTKQITNLTSSSLSFVHASCLKLIKSHYTGYE